MATCSRCGLAVDENVEHTFYAWDIRHECGHTVTYRAICDDLAFSSPLAGQNASAFVARITGEPCPWCGGEVKDRPERPPASVGVIRLTGAENKMANLLAFREGAGLPS
jgi:hypothetical protein